MKKQILSPVFSVVYIVSLQASVREQSVFDVLYIFDWVGYEHMQNLPSISHVVTQARMW